MRSRPCASAWVRASPWQSSGSDLAPGSRTEIGAPARSTGRRASLKAAGAGTAAAFGAVTLSGKESRAATFDAEYDVVVCGGGGGGLPSALFSRWLGNKVLVLEKAGTLGGTSFKAAYWYWVPNNAAMRKAGMEDSKTEFLKY